MNQTFVVTGRLVDDHTLALDQALPALLGRVRVTVEPELFSMPTMDLDEFEQQLRQRQAARGHVPPTVEEVAAFVRAERESWDS